MNEKMTSKAAAATKRYLKLRGFEILEGGWSHGVDTADYIAIDGEKGDLVIVFAEVSSNPPWYHQSAKVGTASQQAWYRE